MSVFFEGRLFIDTFNEVVCRYQDHLTPCCGGWHFVHVRVEKGSYHNWLLTRIEGLDGQSGHGGNE